MSFKSTLIDGLCRLLGKTKYSKLRDKYTTLRKHFRISPVRNIVKLDDDEESVIFIQLREDSDPQKFKSYVEQKYRKKTGHEPKALIVIVNHMEDIKHLDDVDIDQYIPKYKREEDG